MVGIVCGGLPLLGGQPAALEDWPGHVARLEILTQLRDGNEFWSHFYHINTFVLPNVSVDVCIIALHAAGMTVSAAAQVVLLMTYALFVAAATALAWALRTADPFKPLLAVILFYCGPLMDGFVNYMMGVAVALCFLAAWIAVSRPVPRLLIATLGAVVVFFCHLVAVGFFLAVLGLMEFAMLVRERQWNASMLMRHASPLAAAVPAVILFSVSPTSGALRIFYGDDLSVLGIAKNKLSLFLHPVLDGSGLLGAAILIVGATIFVTLMVLAWRRGLLIPRALSSWHILVPGLIGLCLIVPNGVGEGMGLDSRLSPLVFLLAGLFMRLEWRDRGMRLACFTILLVVSLARSASFTHDAAANTEVFDGFAAAARIIPKDSMLLSGIGTPRAAIPWDKFWRPPAEYMGTLATAAQVFVPSVFALRSQHTLVLDDKFFKLHRQFDVSDAVAQAEVRDIARATCETWKVQGHDGSIFMVIVYPSAFSDNAFPPSARRATGTGFQLVDLCVTE
jgi:hypothetical protein